jgi:hypothetical protein
MSCYFIVKLINVNKLFESHVCGSYMDLYKGEVLKSYFDNYKSAIYTEEHCSLKINKIYIFTKQDDIDTYRDLFGNKFCLNSSDEGMISYMQFVWNIINMQNEIIKILRSLSENKLEISGRAIDLLYRIKTNYDAKTHPKYGNPLLINTFKLLRDVNYDSYNSELNYIKSIILIDKKLKNFIINDLAAIVKGYYYSDVILKINEKVLICDDNFYEGYLVENLDGYIIKNIDNVYYIIAKVGINLNNLRMLRNIDISTTKTFGLVYDSNISEKSINEISEKYRIVDITM